MRIYNKNRDTSLYGEERISNSYRFFSVIYALKDSLGFTAFGVPVRGNEVILAIDTIRGSIRKGKTSLVCKDSLLIIVLLINLVHTLCFGLLNYGTIQTSFFFKYVARNVMYIAIILLFSLSERHFSAKQIEYQCSILIKVNFVFFIALYLFGYRMYLGEIINTRGIIDATVTIFGIRITRFFGTASEPGYLCPFLAMPLYYYFTKYNKERKYKFELILLFIFIFMTFSVISYIVAIIVCFFSLRRTGNDSKWVKLGLIIFVFALVFVILYNSIPQVSMFVDSFFLNKLKAVLGMEGQADFSGNDRSMHYNNCISIFLDQSISKKVFGIGTGGYSYRIIGNEELLASAEEAYNIYLSTLLDRGVVGLIIIICLGYGISRYHIKGDIISDSVYIGILSQYIHWMITGNMWLCYFWIEVLYLIGYYRYSKTGEGAMYAIFV